MLEPLCWEHLLKRYSIITQTEQLKALNAIWHSIHHLKWVEAPQLQESQLWALKGDLCAPNFTDM